MTAKMRVGRRGIRRRVGWAAAAGAAGFVVVLVLVATHWQPLRTLDRAVAADLNSALAPHHALVTVLRGITTAGQPLTFQVLAVIAGVALWRVGRGPDGLFVTIAVLAASLLSTIVKSLVSRVRPTVEVTLSHAHGSSFPSGHAITSFVAAGALIIVLVPTLGPRARMPIAAAAVTVAVLVGFSRLALGVHYLSDVVAAWLLGLAWLGAARVVLMSRTRRRAARRVPGRPPGTPTS